MRTPRSLALLLAAVTTLGSTTAFTPRTASADPSAAELDAARKKFQQALDLEKKGQWKEALVLMREVQGVKVSSQVLFHVGLCLENLGKLVEARTMYLRSKEEAETKEGKEGATMLQKSSERIADLDARIPKIRVKLSEDVVSAKVSIDGGEPVSAITTPEIPVDPGTHTVSITSPGRTSFETKVTLKERQPPLVLEPELPREGEGAVEVEAPKKKKAKKEAPPPRLYTEAPAQGPSPLPWVVVGAGGVALATSGILFALRSSVISDLDGRCGPNRDRCPASLENDADRGRTYTVAGNVLLGLGIAGVAGGLTWYFLQPKSKAPAVGLTNGPSGLGLGLVGRF